MAVQTFTINRSQLRALLDALKGRGVFSVTGPRRTEGKAEVDGQIVTVPAGAIRTQQLQHPARDENGRITASRTFTPAGGTLKFNPAEKNLYGPLRPMYNAAVKEQPHNLGKLPERMGVQRRLSFVDLNTATEVVCNCDDHGDTVPSRWIVVDA